MKIKNKMAQKEDIKKAKLKLLVLLLDCQEKTLSYNEVEIMYYLSVDRDIQEILEKGMRIVDK